MGLGCLPADWKTQLIVLNFIIVATVCVYVWFVWCVYGMWCVSVVWYICVSVCGGMCVVCMVCVSGVCVWYVECGVCVYGMWCVGCVCGLCGVVCSYIHMFMEARGLCQVPSSTLPVIFSGRVSH